MTLKRINILTQINKYFFSSCGARNSFIHSGLRYHTNTIKFKKALCLLAWPSIDIIL